MIEPKSGTATAPRDERALVHRILGGDEVAFDAFADRYMPILFRFARRRLHGDIELAWDVVQTTMCKAIPKLSTYRGEASLSTWLCACCRNEIASHFRKRRPERELPLDDGDFGPEAVTAPLGLGPEPGLLRRERRDLVHEALDLLPPHYAEALEWKYLEGASVREIALRLDLSPKAAESLLTRARNAFRQAYADLAEPAPKDLGWPRELVADTESDRPSPLRVAESEGLARAPDVRSRPLNLPRKQS